MIVTPFTHEHIHKTMLDVHVNGNVFPRLTVWDVHKNGNIFLGLTVCDIHTNRNVFWDSSCGMYIRAEMIPYRPHSLGDGSKCRRGKGLKPFV